MPRLRGFELHSRWVPLMCIKQANRKQSKKPKKRQAVV